MRRCFVLQLYRVCEVSTGPVGLWRCVKCLLRVQSFIRPTAQCSCIGPFFRTTQTEWWPIDEHARVVQRVPDRPLDQSALILVEKIEEVLVQWRRLSPSVLSIINGKLHDEISTLLRELNYKWTGSTAEYSNDILRLEFKRRANDTYQIIRYRFEL